jgi:hypothetical protein
MYRQIMWAGRQPLLWHARQSKQPRISLTLEGRRKAVAPATKGSSLRMG